MKSNPPAIPLSLEAPLWRKHGVVGVVALLLLCSCRHAQAQFVYDAGAWYPDRIPAIPAIPATPAVPAVPQIYPPVLLPNSGLPVTAPPSTTPVPLPPPTIQGDVILNRTATTISGCKYNGQLCVHGLPVQVDPVAKTATGSIGGLLFTFQTQ